MKYLPLLGIVAANLVAQVNPVPGVRIWPGSTATRIVVQMSGEFEYTFDRAPNPERLFFDITGARPSFFTRGEQTVPVGGPIVHRIRTARWKPMVLRIVLDLDRPVEFSASKLRNPDRLVVEVRPAGAATEPAPPPVISRRSTPARTGRRATLPPRPRLPAPRPVLLPAPQPVPEPVYVAALPDPTHGRERASRALAPARAARISGASDLSLTRVLGLKLARVVLDAGHGGHDTGTIGSAGLMEKDLVLDLVLRLGQLIEKRLGAEVVYTRSDDTFVGLLERTALANERRADLFLSVHANSSPQNEASGIETFYLNFTDDKYALQVAARENAASEHSIYELQNIVQQIARNDKREESRQFAGSMQRAVHNFAVRGNARARNRGVKSAPFTVLIGARMPSILCEVGFLSNGRDEALLKRNDYRQKLAEALYRGLASYASTLSHLQVAVNKD